MTSYCSPLISLIHRSAWNVHSANFAFTEFLEGLVAGLLFRCLRRRRQRLIQPVVGDAVEEDLPSGLAVALGAILRAELHLVLGTAQRLVELIALPPATAPPTLSHTSAETPTLLDPNPHATSCNNRQYREQKTLFLCGICKPLQPSATTDRALVMSRGKRFESARRLSSLHKICRGNANEKIKDLCRYISF